MCLFYSFYGRINLFVNVFVEIPNHSENRAHRAWYGRMRIEGWSQARFSYAIILLLYSVAPNTEGAFANDLCGNVQ